MIKNIFSVNNKIAQKVLWALSDGRAYTLIELAEYAGASRKEMDAFLKQGMQQDWVVTEKHRFSYYKLKDEEVVHAVWEVLFPKMQAVQKNYHPENPLPALKYCRSCHGHLAGKVGVEIATRMQELKLLYPKRVGEEYLFVMTDSGKAFFEEIGLDVDALSQKSGKLAKACLDFSERKHHLGGRLGVAFLDKLIEKDWIEKHMNSRVKVPTDLGKDQLTQLLGVEWESPSAAEMRMS